MNTIQPEEAREALEVIERTQQQMRRIVATGGAAYYLILWGTIWLLGFGAEYFLGAANHTTGVIWAVLDTTGVIFSMALGWRLSRRVHSSRGASAGLFWLAWLAYTALVIYFAQPADPNHLSLLITLMTMLAYVTAGILYRSKFLATLGIAVTLLAILGFAFFPAMFSLWMAVLGGGSLIAAGVHILRAWR